MKRRVAFLILCGALLASCAARPTEAPRDAATPIAATIDGLVRLFQEECVEQRHLAWARAEAQRRRVYHCTNFWNQLMTPEGKVGDCEADVIGEISWEVPVAGHPNVEVSLTWFNVTEPPYSARTNCTIVAPDSIGPMLREATQRIVEDDPAFAQPPEHYVTGPAGTTRESEGWVWASAARASEDAPQLGLVRYKSTRDGAYTWELKRLISGRIPRPEQRTENP